MCVQGGERLIITDSIGDSLLSPMNSVVDSEPSPIVVDSKIISLIINLFCYGSIVLWSSSSYQPVLTNTVINCLPPISTRAKITRGLDPV